MENHSGKKKTHHHKRHAWWQTCLLCCCCVCHFPTSVAAAQRTPESNQTKEELLYDGIARTLNKDLIKISPDLQNIIDTVLKRVQRPKSSRTTVSCSPRKTLDAQEAFVAAGYQPGTETLTPKSLLSVSMPIVYSAANTEEKCVDLTSPTDNPCLSRNGTDCMSCWIESLTGNKSSLSRTEVGSLVGRLKVSDRSTRSVKIPLDLHDLYDFLNWSPSSDLPKSQVPLMSAFILSKIIQDDLPETLPTAAMFIDELFDQSSAEGQFMTLQRLEAIAVSLKIGRGSNHSDHDNGHDDHDDHDHDHHDHKADESRSQTVPLSNSSNARTKRETEHGHGHEHPDEHHHDESQNRTLECYSLDTLRHIYDLEKNRLTQAEFERLCPALIQQAFSGVCKEHPSHGAAAPPTDRELYGYGTAAVVIVSLLSILGIVFLPMLRKRAYEYALQGFIALGVGTLAGDAFLHLLPEGFGMHNHGSHGHEGEEEEDESGVLWRSVACLGAVYGFFLWEICLHWFIHHKHHSGKKGQVGDHDHRHNHHHDHSHVPDQAVFARAHSKHHDSDTVAKPDGNACEKGKQHDEVATKRQSENLFGLTPLAWMLLLGDSLHNFADGLTIAAAFTQDVRTGISTSIAIFCHEVPHELGDFAILLGTGMSFKKALFLNFVTALTALLGFYVGVPIAKDEAARQWILVVAAGMFLYVALADMLPELKNGKRNLATFVVQNCGLIAGAGIMILLGVFEHAIKI